MIKCTLTGTSQGSKGPVKEATYGHFGPRVFKIYSTDPMNQNSYTLAREMKAIGKRAIE